MANPKKGSSKPVRKATKGAKTRASSKKRPTASKGTQGRPAPRGTQSPPPKGTQGRPLPKGTQSPLPKGTQSPLPKGTQSRLASAEARHRVVPHDHGNWHDQVDAP